MIQLFIELMNLSSGNNWNITTEISDPELLRLCIPSKSLLLLVQNMLIYTEDPSGELRNLFVKISKEEDIAIISIDNVCPADLNKTKAILEELRKSFQSLWNTSVYLEEGNNEIRTGRIMIKVPTEK